MPTFNDVEVDVTTDNGTERLSADVDFEVFCGICGFGLCNQSDTRRSRNRRAPQVTVEPCGRCLLKAEEAAAEKVREELEERIADLQEQLADLQKEVATRTAEALRETNQTEGRSDRQAPTAWHSDCPVQVSG
jgi:DNA-binding transcriptional MerR regulator